MAENTNIALTVEAWADIVIKEWLKMIDALGIGKDASSSGAAIQSFTKHVTVNAAGDPTRIQFAFEWYLKMVDYGVGTSVTIANRDAMLAAGLTKRVKKPWFPVLFKQLEILRHLLEEKNALNVERFLIEKFEEKTK